MRVLTLEVRSLRVLRRIEVEFSPRANLVIGPNGSGKSSLLEALHILGSGRSFRSYRLHDVVSRDDSNLQIVGRTVDQDGLTDTIGIVYSPATGLRIRRSGMDVKAASELVAFLPTVTVTPESYRLVTDGADLRRRIIDKLLFHVKRDYLESYQRYRRALRQRNAAIRSGAPDAELEGWLGELVSTGERLTSERSGYLVRALPTIKETVRRLVGAPIEIEFFRGWSASDSLEAAYGHTLASDRQRGFTQVGPHRADLRFTVEGRPLQHCLSRGETKMLVTAVAVAQARDLGAILGYPPLVVVDDLASELDPASRSRCLAELNAIGSQLFLTAVPGNGLVDVDVEEVRVFHVEQGQITKVV